MTTKTKTKKIDTLRPPQDIRENTKARRAWLAAKAAEITGGVVEGGTLAAKIVGQGSYQEISVYLVSTVEGRTRLRGVCQYCGNEQVLKGEPGVLVLHGYKRPGDGYTFGRCPGTGKAPLNVSDEWTTKWHASATKEAQRAMVQRGTAQRVLDGCQAAMYADGRISDGIRLETGAYKAMPLRPQTRYGRQMTEEQEIEYNAARAAWAKVYPLTAALLDAQDVEREASNALYAAEQTMAHFARLLNSAIKGSPLTVEVV